MNDGSDDGAEVPYAVFRHPVTGDETVGPLSAYPARARRGWVVVDSDVPLADAGMDHVVPLSADEFRGEMAAEQAEDAGRRAERRVASRVAPEASRCIERTQKGERCKFAAVDNGRCTKHAEDRTEEVALVRQWFADGTVRRVREASRVTQGEMARACEERTQSLSDWESGRGYPTASRALRVHRTVVLMAAMSGARTTRLDYGSPHRRVAAVRASELLDLNRREYAQLRMVCDAVTQPMVSGGSFVLGAKPGEPLWGGEGRHVTLTPGPTRVENPTDKPEPIRAWPTDLEDR